MVVTPDAWRMRKHDAVASETISLRDDQYHRQSEVWSRPGPLPHLGTTWRHCFNLALPDSLLVSLYQLVSRCISLLASHRMITRGRIAGSIWM
jgi:hypothetical protein